MLPHRVRSVNAELLRRPIALFDQRRGTCSREIAAHRGLAAGVSRCVSGACRAGSSRDPGRPRVECGRRPAAAGCVGHRAFDMPVPCRRGQATLASRPSLGFCTLGSRVRLAVWRWIPRTVTASPSGGSEGFSGAARDAENRIIMSGRAPDTWCGSDAVRIDVVAGLRAWASGAAEGALVALGGDRLPVRRRCGGLD